MPSPFVWFEVNTPDAAGSRKFYTELLGWGVEEWDMGQGSPYAMFKHGDETFGGIQPMEGPQWEGVPPHWMIYVGVDDVDATAAKAVALGGKILMPAFDIPEVGRICVIQDPQGAAISLYKSSSQS